MRLNRFDLNLLIALDALLREKNVTRAAERVCVSQPAMSAALAKLREYFHDSLLVRVGRDMELTPRARALLEPTHNMLLSAQAVLGGRAVFDPSVDRRTFTVLSPDHVAAWVMPALLRRLEARAPGIRIQVERPSVPGIARLTQANIDLLLAIDAQDSLPMTDLSGSLCSAFVSSIRYVAVVSADHPEVAGRPTTEQFLRLPHVVVRAFGRPSLIEKTAQKRYRVELDIRAVTDSVLEVPLLVTGTSLIGVIPAQFARVLGQSSRVRIVDLPEGVMPASRLDLLWHRTFESDPGHTWMRGLILNESSGATSGVHAPAMRAATRLTVNGSNTGFQVAD